MYSSSCTNTHYDVTTLEVDGNLNNSSAQHDFSMKKILKLCHKYYIFRSYHFSVVVTFNTNYSLTSSLYRCFYSTKTSNIKMKALPVLLIFSYALVIPLHRSRNL